VGKAPPQQITAVEDAAGWQPGAPVTLYGRRLDIEEPSLTERNRVEHVNVKRSVLQPHRPSSGDRIELVAIRMTALHEHLVVVPHGPNHRPPFPLPQPRPQRLLQLGDAAARRAVDSTQRAREAQKVAVGVVKSGDDPPATGVHQPRPRSCQAAQIPVPADGLDDPAAHRDGVNPRLYAASYPPTGDQQIGVAR
jgi:hypothetical protein